MSNFSIFLFLCAFKISCLIELSMKKSFITSGPCLVSKIDGFTVSMFLDAKNA